MKHLATLNHYLYRYKWRLLLGVCFVALSNVFKVLVPQSVRNGLNYVTDAIKEYDLAPAAEKAGFSEIVDATLFKFGLTVIGFTILTGIFMYFMRQTIIVVSRLIEYDMRKDLFAHYEKLDTAFYKRNKTGDLMSRITEDVSKVRMYLGPALLYGINLSTLFIVVIYAMLQVSLKLTLWTLLPLPFLSVSIYLVSSMIHKKSELIQIQLAKLNSISQEVFSGIRVVKSYNKETQFVAHFDEACAEYKSKSLALAKVNALFYPLMILLIGISVMITVYVGGVEVSKGNITYGNIAEFIIYVNYLTWPFTSVGWIASLIQQADASQKRINAFLNTEASISNGQDILEEISGDIHFKNVNFTYPDTGIHAIKNLNLQIKKGEKVAIIGRTAAGKSTLADLLLRMYDIDQGQISIGGKNINELNLQSLRNGIGYVPQDVFLFSDTIENNIRFGHAEASLEEIKQYAQYASVHHEIEKLSNKYQTLVGERGVTLSGGQKQRVSIARAFIKDPEIIILDDCLSAVDANTEKVVLEYLSEVIKNKTAIIITHRIYGLLSFDKILVLDDGEIIENGTHEELMELKGHYFDLYEHQHQDLELDEG